MKQLLIEHKNLVEQMIASLAFSFHGHIQVVDGNMDEISVHVQAATQTMPYEPIYLEVLKHEKMMVVNNPRKDRLCKDCPEGNRCLRKMEIAFPIRLGGQICGILGIFCHTLSERDNICLDLDASLSQVARLVHLLEAGLEHYAQKQEKEAFTRVYRRAAENLGQYFIEVNQMNEITCASEAFMAITGIKTPFKAEIMSLGRDLYEVITDGKRQILIKGEKHMVDEGALFLFNTVDDALLPNLIPTGELVEYMPEIIGQTEGVARLRSIVMKSAKTNSIVFIGGKSGSGKENAARCIHYHSSRREHLFVKVDCGELSGHVFYEELFGGQNSGTGKLFLADKGVLFLKNADHAPMNALAALIQSVRAGKVVYKGRTAQNIDVRLIFSSCNENLAKAVGGLAGPGIHIIPVHVPPLYRIADDIREYVHYFTKQYQIENSIDNITLDNDIISMLRKYSWPGNFKEFKAITGQMVDFYHRNDFIDSEIVRKMLSASFAGYHPDSGRTVKFIENNHIAMTVMRHGGSVYDKQMAADELGIGIATLYRKLGYGKL